MCKGHSTLLLPIQDEHLGYLALLFNRMLSLPQVVQKEHVSEFQLQPVRLGRVEVPNSAHQLWLNPATAAVNPLTPSDTYFPDLLVTFFLSQSWIMGAVLRWQF